MTTVIDQLINDIHTHNINYHSRELYLHAYCDDNSDNTPGVDYRMATKFVKNLHILESQNNKNILVHMHTDGGSWSDGMAMYNAMRLFKSPVTIIAYAEASSMSGVLLQAADKRIMMPDCSLMIHHGSIGVEDSSVAVKQAIEQNQKNCKRMLEIFALRAVEGEYFKSRNYNVKKTMNYIDLKLKQTSDWYLTSEEAIYYGFADAIYGEKGAETIKKMRTGRKKKF